jgi:hypothetical protein
MSKMHLGFFVGVALMGVLTPSARAGGGWSVGVRLGFPVCAPCYGYGPYYYQPYPVYVAPPPVYYAPPVVQQAPVLVPAPAPPVPEAPAPRPVAVQTVAADGGRASVDRYVQLLRSPEENVRLDGATQLGRLQDQRALDPLAATLSGDASPAVREAAARSLALIGSPRAIPALRQAAQNDHDHDVRHSAQFALDVLQTKY